MNRLTSLLTLGPYVLRSNDIYPNRSRPQAALRLIGSFLIAFAVVMPFGSGAVAQDAEDEISPVQLAGRYLAYQQFDKAYKAFRKVHQDMPVSDPQWPLVTYSMAHAQWHRTPASAQTVSDARSLFESILTKQPDSDIVPRARMSLGRLHELSDHAGDEIDLAAAESQYDQVMADYPDQPIIHEAAFRKAGVIFKRWQEDPQAPIRSCEYLVQWLQKYPDNPFASGMWQTIGFVQWSFLRNAETALAAYLRADELGLQDTINAGRTFWTIATLAEQTGKLETAVKFHRKIVIETPRSGRAYESRLVLKRLKAENPSMSIDVPPLQDQFTRLKQGRAQGSQP